MPHRTPKHQAELLATGRSLAGQGGLAAITVPALCEGAGISERTFKRLYPGLNAYLGQLARVQLDEARDLLTRMTHNMPPGLPRLKLAMETYLQANLQRPLLREIMRDLRTDPAIETLMRERITGFTMMTGLELRRAKWPRPEMTARLLTTAVLETIFAEFEAGRVLPEYRATLFRYLDHRSP